MTDKVLLEASNVKKYFLVKNSLIKGRRKYLKAVDDVNLVVHEGETVGLVGESGCGKSTLGRSLLKLHSITGGTISFKGENIESYGFGKMRELRKEMQIVFQDPYASLNPRMSIYNSVKAPLDVFHIGTEEEKKERIEGLLDYVGIGKQHMEKYPHELSGGQRQRIFIARAMILDPSFIVCDEPVSALDVSVRSQVLNLMKKIQAENNVSYLFISHDLSVVRYICDVVAVMYLGKIVEQGTKEELFDHPVHPYTKALLSAIPIPDIHVKTKRIVIQGDIPSPLNPPTGCRFHTRCPYATDICSQEEPAMRNVGGRHMVACHHIDDIAD